MNIKNNSAKSKISLQYLNLEEKIFPLVLIGLVNEIGNININREQVDNGHKYSRPGVGKQ